MPWWKVSRSAKGDWRDLGKEELVDTYDGERELAWKEHGGSAFLWSGGRGGAMWQSEYDGGDNHEEKGRGKQQNDAMTMVEVDSGSDVQWPHQQYLQGQMWNWQLRTQLEDKAQRSCILKRRHRYREGIRMPATVRKRRAELQRSCRDATERQRQCLLGESW